MSQLTDDSYDDEDDNWKNTRNTSSLRDASKVTDDASLSSTKSARSTRSSKSTTLSHRLKAASQRGEERARHISSGSSVSSVSSDRRKKVDVSSIVKNKAATLEKVVDLSLVESERKKKKKKSRPDSERGEDIETISKSSRSKGSHSSKSQSSKNSSKSSSRSKKKKWDTTSSLGSQLNPSKYTDLGYLTKSAGQKFQKGVYLLRKEKYQMASEYVDSTSLYTMCVLFVMVLFLVGVLISWMLFFIYVWLPQM